MAYGNSKKGSTKRTASNTRAKKPMTYGRTRLSKRPGAPKSTAVMGTKGGPSRITGRRPKHV